MIHISLSPNAQNDDRRLAARLLIQPWKWRKGSALNDFTQAFKAYHGVRQQPLLLNSGRSALYTILQALNLQSGDEVLVQAFTCNAVPNPIRWCGAKPVYVDMEKDGWNMDPLDLTRKITPRARAVIVQHTFGIPADMDSILAIARNNKLFVIEDCAHALGAEYGGKRIGTLGDAAFFSFGRDKVISSVYGGALIIYNKEVAQRARRMGEALAECSRAWVLQQILHPLITTPLVLGYWHGGRWILALLQKMGILSLAISSQEKRGEKPFYFPARMPNALASLALQQLRKIDIFNSHRRALALRYEEEFHLFEPYFREHDKKVGSPIFLRYPMRHPHTKEILSRAKRAGMILGDWYDEVVAPRGTDASGMGYIAGSCPNAEQAVLEAINLPTHINTSAQDAERIAKFYQKEKALF